MDLRCSVLAVAVAAAVLLPAGAALAGPELTLDVERIESSIVIENEIFHPPSGRVPRDAVAPVSGNCVLDPSEDCVGGAGIRKLLRFDVLVHNTGDEDLVLGDPRLLPELFERSECHGHVHFAQASIYELLDADGAVVAPGHKQGFCIQDTTRSSSATRTRPRYDCDDQGLQVGWADLYASDLDCQWVDVTDVPPGAYLLHVRWNPARLLADGDPTDDEAFVPVVLGEPSSSPPEVRRVTRPNPSSWYAAGRTMSIHWSARDDEAVVSQEVWFSADDGATWEQLVGDLDGDAAWYRWPIPADLATSRGRIRVVARDGEAQQGAAISGRFRIQRSGRARRVPIRRRPTARLPVG